MNPLKRLISIISILLIALSIASCSDGKIPTNPAGRSNDYPESQSIDLSNRDIVAVFNLSIDPETQSISLKSSERFATFHLPLTSYFPNVLQITGYGWTPNFWADIKLSHPFPGSGIDAFDPRVIAILPANAGVSFNYPVFNVIGNNSVVMEPDCYTKLFDNLGGSIPGNTNPFKAYFKSQPNRKWSSTGTTFETQRWNLKLTGFGGPITFKLVVDVSTNYPNPPQPVIDNAPEPVEIKTVVGDGLTDAGGNASIDVTFTDWQGPSEIKCKVEAPGLFIGSVQIDYSAPGPNPNEYIFSGSISNSLLAPAGDYKILIAAWDIPSDVHVFSEATAVVFPASFNLKDVTPPWLISKPMDICINGNYAYVANEQYGLCVLELSNPVDPAWIGTVDTSGSANDVFISGNYAYVADGESGLQIINISDPEAPYIEKTVNTPDDAKSVDVQNGYAFVADNTGIQIIDVEPIGSAYIVRGVSSSGRTASIDATTGYAYAGNIDYGLQIFDIDPIGSAFLANTLTTPDTRVNDVQILGNYAYVADNWGGLVVVDISSQPSVSIAKQIETATYALDVFVNSDYAYVAGQQPGLTVIDINPLVDAQIVGMVELPKPTNTGIAVRGDYAYVANQETGIEVIDINPPDAANWVKRAFTPVNANSVVIDGNYVYASNGFIGLNVVDVTTPEMANAVSTVFTDYNTVNCEVAVQGGMVYMSSILEYFIPIGALEIIDASVPEDAYMVNRLGPIGRGFSSAIDIEKEFAYFINDKEGLYIVDVEPPESAAIANNLDLPDYDYGLKVDGGYAYVSSWENGLQIVDVDPVESMSLVKTVDTPGYASAVDVSNGFAYLADGAVGLQIIDINPPDQANIVKTVDTPGNATGIFVAGGFAYIADNETGLQIINVDPPSSAHIVSSIDTPGIAHDVYVSGNYAYVADGDGGLRIIKLRS